MANTPGTLTPFHIERFFDAYEDLCTTHNLAETCCASISLDELSELSGVPVPPFPPTKRLTYGSISGTPELRQAIAERYGGGQKGFGPENALVTQGAISGNFLVFYSLLLGAKEGEEKGEVVCMYPVYQQLYAVCESLGFKIRLWKQKAEDGWKLHTEELKSLVNDKTKLVVICNPNNPTGAYIDAEQMREIIDIVRSTNPELPILCDEVYSGTFHSVTKAPSIVDYYENGISTCSLSKSYSCAGLRLGWVFSPNKHLVEKALDARHYTTLSVSMLDDHYAHYVLSPQVSNALLQRNTSLASTNIEILSDFIDANPSLSWIKPKAGSVALVNFNGVLKGSMTDADFLIKLVKETGVLMGPGSAFGLYGDFAGWVRVGYCCATDELKAGLQVLQKVIIEMTL